ncbi:MAG: ArnT family glycosyltransferase, partial [Acidobacteriota bacterium]
MIGLKSAFGFQPARGVVPTLIFLVILIFAGRAGHSYLVTAAIYDEPHHIAAGMEWLVKGVYKYEAKHPPIARVLFALPLYLKGLRSQGLAIPPDEGNAILMSDGQYRQNLLLARLGNIPFLLLTVWAILLWSARWFSRPTALVALFLLLNLPPVIGHFSVATTDFSQAGTLLLAGYAILRWSEEQKTRSTVLMGLAISLAILCKLSNLFFVLLILLVVLGFRWWQRQRGRLLPPLTLRPASRDALMVLVMVMMAICVAYRFYSPPLSVKKGIHPLLDQRITPGSPLSRMAYLAVETPSPFNSFISGINELRSHNRQGHLSYLLGEVRMDGWWYFFPIVLSLKTPLSIILLFLLFLFTLFRNRGTARPAGQLILLAIAASILLFSMTSNINAGIRHILSVYFFLALALSDFIVTQFRTKSHLRPLLVLLLVLFAFESREAGSDHIGYFNR